MDNYDTAMTFAYDEVTHGCDGPITVFVIMARATRLAARGSVKPEIVAEAMLYALRDFGYLSEEGCREIYPTGS